jgi:nicotinamidase-related amidase
MALLVMDMQVGIVTRYVQTGDFLTPISTAITTARAASIPVIYVAVAFRPGYPEMSPRNKSFSAIKQQKMHLRHKRFALQLLRELLFFENGFLMPF